RGLAITGAIVDVVGSDDGTSELLHQITVFIGGFRRSNHGDRVRAVLLFDTRQFRRDQIQGFFPAGLAETASFTYEGLLQAVRVIDIIPAELALNTRRDLIRIAVPRINLENFT